MREKGLVLTNNLVVDKKNFVNGSKGTIPYVSIYDRQHNLTKDASEDVFFPLVSGMFTEANDRASLWRMLAWSSQYPHAWARSRIEKLKSLDFNFEEGVDIKGPLAYIAAYENDKNKMLVFGNSSFVANTYKKFTQNLVLALNGMSWVSGEKDVLTFDVPQIKDRPLFIGEQQMSVIFYFSVLCAPLILVIVSFFLYRRRQV